MSSKLGLNDRIIHQALSEDDLILCNIAQAILDSDQDKKIVLTLRGDDAERFMTAMQIVMSSLLIIIVLLILRCVRFWTRPPSRVLPMALVHAGADSWLSFRRNPTFYRRRYP